MKVLPEPSTPKLGSSDADPRSLIECDVEAYSEGERRGHARGRLHEIATGVFLVTPQSLNEVSGPAIKWMSPIPGSPIDLPVSFDDALKLLTWRATYTMAICASPILPQKADHSSSSIPSFDDFFPDQDK